MVNQQKVHFRVIVTVRDRIRDRIYHRSVDLLQIRYFIIALTLKNLLNNVYCLVSKDQFRHFGKVLCHIQKFFPPFNHFPN